MHVRGYVRSGARTDERRIFATIRGKKNNKRKGKRKEKRNTTHVFCEGAGPEAQSREVRGTQAHGTEEPRYGGRVCGVAVRLGELKEDLGFAVVSENKGQEGRRGSESNLIGCNFFAGRSWICCCGREKGGGKGAGERTRTPRIYGVRRKQETVLAFLLSSCKR